MLYVYFVVYTFCLLLKDTIYILSIAQRHYIHFVYCSKTLYTFCLLLKDTIYILSIAQRHYIHFVYCSKTLYTFWLLLKDTNHCRKLFGSINSLKDIAENIAFYNLFGRILLSLILLSALMKTQEA